MAKIQLRRGTAAQWTSVDPVLANGEPGYETDTGKIKYGNGSDEWSALPYAHASAGGEAFPVGAVYINVTGVNPATELGYGTWSAFGAGRVMVGYDAGDADFDAAEETGGAKTKAISAHSGAAVADHAAHTHSYTEVPNHVHIIASGQGSHQHGMDEGTTDGSGTFMDRSNAAAATNAVTNLATLPEMVTNNPTGGVASGTTGNPSATLTHSVTQPSAHTDLNVVQPYIVAHFWKRTA